MELSPDQQQAHDAILAFLGQRASKLLTLGGFAGTGKTTVISQAVRSFRRIYGRRPRIAFGALTGKASHVLKEKLLKAGCLVDEGKHDYCGTIHGLIYVPIIPDEKTGIVTGWAKRDSVDHDLVVIDEASMVTDKVYNDLKGYNKPILAVGDHGQLPPVASSFNLMEAPHIRLEKIHRQAEDNPIIKVSMMAREQGEIPRGSWGDCVWKRGSDFPALDRVSDLRNVMVLCGKNRTRVDLNQRIREKLGITDEEPVDGDKVICLRNKMKLGLANGMLGTLAEVERTGSHYYMADLAMEAPAFKLGGQRLCRYSFGEEKVPEEIDGVDAKDRGLIFDWGYALTVHKSQGSEADRVLLFEERMWGMSDENWARWLYTAVTRAKTKLLIIEDDR